MSENETEMLTLKANFKPEVFSIMFDLVMHYYYASLCMYGCGEFTSIPCQVNVIGIILCYRQVNLCHPMLTG